MSFTENGKPNVIIVGAGNGSVTAAKIAQTLDPASYNVLLIDARPHRLYLPATPRMLVSAADGLEHTALVKFDKLFKNSPHAHFIQARVTAIHKGEKLGGSVILDNGEKLPFVALVLATGSLWGGPFAFPDTREETDTWIAARREEFKNAKSIAIVGAGAGGLGSISPSVLRKLLIAVLPIF